MFFTGASGCFPKTLLAWTTKEQRRRATGEFDDLLGSFPEGTSVVLSDILSYLQEYLFDYKHLSEEEVRRLLDERQTRIHKKGGGFRAFAGHLDEGVDVAVGILNSIRSTLRVKGTQITPKKLNGRPIYKRELTAEERVRFLLSGLDGLRGARVRIGGGKRSQKWGDENDKERWYRQMQELIDEAARQRPYCSYRQLAKYVAQTKGCSERTVRRHTRNPRR